MLYLWSILSFARLKTTLTTMAKERSCFHVVYVLSEELNRNDDWDGERGFIHLSIDKFLDKGVRR